ncbi:MAG TPA: hypothetical protein VIK08_12540, partial [Candidatus Limnocylindrales bacterium]
MFYSNERQLEIRDGVAHGVVQSLVLQSNENAALLRSRLEAASGESGGESIGAFLDLDREDRRAGGEGGYRRRPQQPAGIHGQQVTAYLLDF